MTNIQDRKIHLDPETAAWCMRTDAEEINLTYCYKCGMYYKPELGHKCKEALEK